MTAGTCRQPASRLFQLPPHGPMKPCGRLWKTCRRFGMMPGPETRDWRARAGGRGSYALAQDGVQRRKAPLFRA